MDPETYIVKGGRFCIRHKVLELMSILDGIKVVERFFTVPLDYDEPSGDKIRVFARSLIPLSKANQDEKEKDLPYSMHAVFVRCNGCEL